MRNKKRICAMATAFAVALGAIGLTGFAKSWKASADDQGYTPLPEAATTFEVETQYYYTYANVGSGFYSVNLVSMTAGDVELTSDEYFYSITVRPNPESYDNTVFVSENNYPVYMAADTTYYLDIFISYAAGYTTVNAQFAVQSYDKDAVEVTPDAFVYLPVTAEAGTYTVNSSGWKADTAYEMIVTDVSENDYVEVYSQNGLIEKLDSANGFRGVVEMNGVTALYLKSESNFVAGLFISEYAEIKDMDASIENEVTLEGGTTKAYRLSPLEAGSYSMVVRDNNGFVEVWNSNALLIRAGYNFGVFSVIEGEGVILVFSNLGETPATIGVAVQKYDATAHSFELGSTEKITLAAGEIQGYYVTGLLQTGAYNVKLSENKNVVVTNSLVDSVVNAGKLEGSFTATEAVISDGVQESAEGRFLFVFENSGEESTTFDITVSYGETITLGEAKSVIVNGGVAYNMLLPTGVYEISLNSDKVAVTVNSEEIKLYNGNVGSFFVASIDPTDPDEGNIPTDPVSDTPTDATVAIQFSTTEEVAFTVTVKSATKLELDTPTTITLDGSTAYYMTLPEGYYTIELTDGTVAVYVNNEETVLSGEAYGVFYVMTVEPEEGQAEDAYVMIMFSGVGTCTVKVSKL